MTTFAHVIKCVCLPDRTPVAFLTLKLAGADAIRQRWKVKNGTVWVDDHRVIWESESFATFGAQLKILIICIIFYAFKAKARPTKL